ncbi:uncharacterized protein LOC107019356 [Solanum pennellii]|uniref:Uncharacterized protein LOC107019356 n=1 Tax=Solanum pennellii TaxID=28526 RepID=A0ABM1GSP9_SOLPN|nr:uncharacterized protein LOC107019356 [Solanum pennellii]
MGATIAMTTTTGSTMATKTIGLGPIFLIKIGNLAIRKLEQNYPNPNKRRALCGSHYSRQTVAPPIPHEVETDISKDDDVIKKGRKFENVIDKESLVSRNWCHTSTSASFCTKISKEDKRRENHRLITMLKQLSINVPLIEALEKMLGCANFMKDMVTKKRIVNFEDDEKLQHCIAIATRSLWLKNEDLGAFTIPFTIETLCYLAASINLMPLSIYMKLDLVDPKPTTIQLLMADRNVKRPIGVLHDVLVKVESLIFPDYFFILYSEVDFEDPIILGKPFLATGRALIDMDKWRIKFKLNIDKATSNICRSIKQSGELKSVYDITYRVEISFEKNLRRDCVLRHYQ